ncbi:conserved membrane hypothetical protein [Candidatus Sulfopaludibacter sp. SbA3]|nr:conserved membrane hypothetical protein [Candidatus Sulfopaludibacter sp. SbA3]
MQRNEERVERTIGVMLRVGVITAASVVFAGGVWYLARFGMLIPNYQTFHGEPRDLRSVMGVLGGVFRLQPRSVIQFGLLLLIATPIARVAFSVIAFAIQRDRVYVALSVVVLAVLVWSLSGM